MVKSLRMPLVYCPGLACIQEGWQYHGLVDFQLCVKLDSISLPDICTEINSIHIMLLSNHRMKSMVSLPRKTLFKNQIFSIFVLSTGSQLTKINIGNTGSQNSLLSLIFSRWGGGGWGGGLGGGYLYLATPKTYATPVLCIFHIFWLLGNGLYCLIIVLYSKCFTKCHKFAEINKRINDQLNKLYVEL